MNPNTNTLTASNLVATTATIPTLQGSVAVAGVFQSNTANFGGDITAPTATIPTLNCTTTTTGILNVDDVVVTGQIKQALGTAQIPLNYIQIQTESSNITFSFFNISTQGYYGGTYAAIPTSSPKRAYGQNSNVWVISQNVNPNYFQSQWLLQTGVPNGCWRIEASLTYTNLIVNQRVSPTLQLRHFDGTSVTNSTMEPTYARLVEGKMTRVKTSMIIACLNSSTNIMTVFTGLNIGGTIDYGDTTNTFSVKDFEIQFQYMGNNLEYNTT